MIIKPLKRKISRFKRRITGDRNKNKNGTLISKEAETDIQWREKRKI